MEKYLSKIRKSPLFLGITEEDEETGEGLRVSMQLTG